ncbi:uncharacterized protein SAMN05444401_1365 [Clostridium amylolyticum]|uniref:DUF177 domain-containing protein n=1 Tax=Clostridium amylolyticum TaxID=1121298 RepID=A0A1M6D7J8_9CLOT|nr:DUF177 domain-containing protein [Clostridium amylolyticum]SHI69163.1 uncharacterized protein SAMN05444401_1365 [Clostridium amylolyticum]
MKIEFNDLFKRKNFTKDLEGTFTMESFLYEGDEIVFKSPVKAKGKASVLEDIIQLDMEVSAVIELTCTRCLDRYTSNINLNIFEEYTNDSQKENEDIIFITEEYLDIKKVITDNILLSLPIKKLCSNDCKGLCQNCGANLNRNTCNCPQEDVDIRMAKLKNLFLSD